MWKWILDNIITKFRRRETFMRSPAPERLTLTKTQSLFKINNNNKITNKPLEIDSKRVANNNGTRQKPLADMSINLVAKLQTSTTINSRVKQNDSVKENDYLFSSKQEKYKEVQLLKKINNLEELFEIDKSELGSGRYGVVRKATPKKKLGMKNPMEANPLIDDDDEEAIDVAIKSVPISLMGRNDILTEISCLYRVSGHVNVQKIIDSYETDGFYHIVTPLYSGGELFERIIKNGKFDESDASRIISELLNAILHLKKRHVVHRDIKPENCLLTKRGRLVLVDFGLARVWKPITPGSTMYLKCGSPTYVAPEVVAGRYTDECDLWSIGVILYILITGVAPFGDGNDDETLKNVQNSDFPIDWSNELWRESTSARDLTQQLMNRDYSKRITAEEALKHPFIVDQGGYFPYSLDFVVDRFTKFNEKSKFQKAVITLIAQILQKEGGAGGVKIVNDFNNFKSSKFYMFNRKKLNFGDDINLASSLKKNIYLDEANLRKAFQIIDENKDGFIDVNELVLLFKSNKEDDKEFEKLVRETFLQADTDANLKIDFEEFCKVMKKT